MPDPRSMKRSWLWVALGLAVGMTLVHVIVGGRLIAEPLLASDLETLPRMTLYLCWHGITSVLAGMAMLFADGLVRGRRESVALAGGLAAAFFVLGWTYILGFGLSPLDLPQWIAFGPMAFAAGVALRENRALPRA